MMRVERTAAAQLRIAIMGGKNSGKSALFNTLTGQKAHVGNYPGVTTHMQPAPLKADYRKPFSKTADRRQATARSAAAPTSAHVAARATAPATAVPARATAPAVPSDIQVVDFPGIGSLNAYGPEERDVLRSLADETPDVIVDVIDATNIEVGLYLALQLLELNTPMVIALNMMDEAARNGVFVNTEALERALRVPVVPVSATKVRGITELVEAVADLVGTSVDSKERPDFCSGDLHKAIHSICHIIEVPAREKGLPVRFAAEKLIEHDEGMARLLDIREPEDVHVIAHIIEHLEADTGFSGETVLAKERYAYVDGLCAAHVRRAPKTPRQERSQRIDRLLTHRIGGIPIFLGIMAVVFWLTFVVIGGPLQSLLEKLFEAAGNALGGFMLEQGVSYWLYDLAVNGAWAGVCSVLSFLPIILVLFFFLSILEDSGYTTRVAFVMDKLLRKIGLSGRSLAPLIVGFGCNVPALMATRTLPSERDRRLTILLIPFMSCSAKLPVYAMITGAFFGARAGLAMIALYVLGVVVAILLGFVLSRTVFKGDASMYVMELPDYRIPELGDVLRHMWDNTREFVKKAFTIIFLGTVVIWFLQNFDLSFNAVDDSAESILAFIGTKISFIFGPIGLDSWQPTTALLAGLAAKEAIVSTLTVLMGGATGAALTTALAQVFTPLTAFVFLAFVLLYVPCLATFATTRKELGSTAQALGIVVLQLVLAYAVCFVIYSVGKIAGL